MNSPQACLDTWHHCTRSCTTRQPWPNTTLVILSWALQRIHPSMGHPTSSQQLLSGLRQGTPCRDSQPHQALLLWLPNVCRSISLSHVFINDSLKTRKASEIQISVFLFLGCIYVHICITAEENTFQYKKGKKTSYFFKALKGLIWTRRLDPKPPGTLEVQFYECNNSCKFLNYRVGALQLQTVSIYC